MHILFFSHYFPPEVNAPASRTYEHCVRWVQAGHRVTVVTCAPNCPTGLVYPGYRNAWCDKESVDGIDVVRVWTYIAANKGFLPRILNYVSYLIHATLYGVTVSDADVIVATSPQFFCGWAGAVTSWFRRCPFVLEIRDLWPESIVTVGAMRKSWLTRGLEWLERALYSSATHIVTVGEGYREGLMERGVPDEKISVVTNGVDLAKFRPTGSPSRLRKELSATDRFVCAYIGTVGMAHGLEVLLDAAERFQQQEQDDVAFWIVGDGARRAELESDAQHRGLRNVHFLGLLAKEELPDVIAACDACLVHLKGTELFTRVMPSKLFEFMALDVPIIVGVQGQARDIVLDAGAGVEMRPEDPDSLCECIEKIRSRPKSSFCGRDYVARNFDRNQLAMDMLDVLLRFSKTPKTTVRHAGA